MQRTNEDIAREMYERLFHEGDASVLDRYVDPAFVYQNPMKPVEGRQQIVDLVNAQKAAFEDYSLTIDLVAGNDSAVAVAWTINGVHKRAFFDYPPSGRPIRFSGITLHRFENGRSMEAWSYSNMSEMLIAPLDR
ncbi:MULTISPECIES: ester cyclase [unclassified Sphingomonas]|uniref:ester cyclase n=1 Tax=unclassified Sphingomonas TaxID=196159 RepID=UPI000A433691|nr:MULTISPECIES: ester cyclase [unclassified Sphingomonas]